MHHIQLSVMADVKANALMTISAVMLTFSAPFIRSTPFTSAVIMIMVSSLTTIVLAIFAVMPGATPKIAAQASKAAENVSSNLLFFGTFVQMGYQQFEDAMEELMNDPSKTYQVQVREIYTLGVYLAAKKYRYLRFAYFTFTIGLFTSGAILCWSVLSSR